MIRLYNCDMRFLAMKTGSSTMIVRSTILTCAAIAAVMLPASAFAAGQPQAPLQAMGLWVDHTGKGGIKIEPCGAKLCGKIVWLRDTLNAEGKPMTDRHNPDAVKQQRPLCGVQVLGELAPVPGGGFDGGWIYDPKEGKTYNAAIDVAGPTQLTVTGYLGIRLMGQSFTWTRASGELPACDAAPKDAATNGGAKQAGAVAKSAVAAPAAAVPAITVPKAAAAAANQATRPTTATAKPVTVTAPKTPATVDEAQIVKRARTATGALAGPSTAAPFAQGQPAKPAAVTTSSTAKTTGKPPSANITAPKKPVAAPAAAQPQQNPVLPKTAPQKQTAATPSLQKAAKPAVAQKEILPWATTTTAISKPVKKSPQAQLNTGAPPTSGVPVKTAAKPTVAQKAIAKKPSAQPVEDLSQGEDVSGSGQLPNIPTQLPPSAATLN